MRLLITLALATMPFWAVAQDEHVKLSILSERSALVPGQTAWVGIRFEHAPRWHTYWINPGDSGLSTKLSWQLPPGYHAGEIAWPAPQRIAVADLYNFGYEGDVLLPVPIEVPANASPGAPVHIGVEVKYLVCHEECVPGKANVALDLPVRAGAERTPAAALFDTARAALPQPAEWHGEARVNSGDIEVTLHGVDPATISDAFVVPRKLVNYAPPRIARNGADVSLRFEKSDYFVSAPARVELVVRSGAQARSVSVPFSTSPE